MAEIPSQLRQRLPPPAEILSISSLSHRCPSWSDLSPFSQPLVCSVAAYSTKSAYGIKSGSWCYYVIPSTLPARLTNGFSRSLMIKVGRLAAYETEDDVNREFKMADMMGQKSIGPLVLDVRVCLPYYVIVMRAVDETLQAYINQPNREYNLDLYNRLRKRLISLYNLGYEHGDLRAENIGITFEDHKDINSSIRDVKLLNFAYTQLIQPPTNPEDTNPYDAWSELVKRAEEPGSSVDIWPLIDTDPGRLYLIGADLHLWSTADIYGGENQSFEQVQNRTRKCPEWLILSPFSDKLGCGAYGCVYGIPTVFAAPLSAKYRDRNVVVKIGVPDAGVDIQEEYRLALIMSEVGIGPRVIDFLVCPPYFAIVMQRIDMTLQQYIDQLPPTIPPRIENINRAIFRMLLARLQELWDLGYVHGDVKSDNIGLIFQKRGNIKSPVAEVKLIDFGLTKKLTPKQKMSGDPYRNEILYKEFENEQKLVKWKRVFNSRIFNEEVVEVKGDDAYRLWAIGGELGFWPTT